MAAIATQAAKSVLTRLNVNVHLSDGTLVGKLTPLIDRQLGPRNRTAALPVPA